ncbi:hypothetical protein DesfrDRAFT_1540 [Solidesulfovibrio fructosivorans JJ]]|uniref:Uncharacterized protein n=1 Tax=Solidesulfovibrio fructosivorans JJ] TaxID=596151 RepID=E1JV91_SOLFR|nr:hypothetical protein [Solidesulfovibrio fructosivorans]EFL51685.1 hypothetical protein DesfrDRAFT_1540 [Solidesulfovibrio fructosivorans JJ]]
MKQRISTQLESFCTSPHTETRQCIDFDRAKLKYFDPRIMELGDLNSCASQCPSCGVRSLVENTPLA